MIDFEKYITTHFQPLDIVGTTSFGPLARIIWRNTWARNDPFFWLKWYRLRSMLSTHIDVTCIGEDGKAGIMGMDRSAMQVRYLSLEREGEMWTEREFRSRILSGPFRRVEVYSGIRRREPSIYFTTNVRHAHVCWIGRYPGLTIKQLRAGNEWLFETHRQGVPYDYWDILSMWQVLDRFDFKGSNRAFICSEYPQRCYEKLGILRYKRAPMTPKEWQQSPLMKEVKV